MAIAASAIIEGAVMRCATRTVVSNKTTPPTTYKFTNALVIGDDTLCDVRIPDNITPPVVGDMIRARVNITSYRNEAEFELSEYLA